MAEPARRSPAVDEPPLIDPTAIQREYRRQRARRHFREQRSRERSLARLRFVAVTAALIVLTAYVCLVVWRQVEHLFGL